MKILCLGDSITAGIGGTAGRSYPDIMYNKLKREGIKTEIINSGRPGDSTLDFFNYLETTVNTINNLNELIPWFKPMICYDLVLIMLGTNDCRTDNWVETEDSLKYLGRIIDQVNIWTRSKKKIIISTIIPLADPMPPKIVGGAHKWEQDRIVNEINPGIRKLARKKGISFFDMYSLFKKEISSGKELYDGIHPYNSGYRFMGNQMADYIISKFIDK
jgi:lysophospholipase L1-like esterase